MKKNAPTLPLSFANADAHFIPPTNENSSFVINSFYICKICKQFVFKLSKA